MVYMSKTTLNTSAAVIVAVAVIGYFFFMGAKPSAPQNGQGGAQNPAGSVVIQDIKTGTGAEAAAGMNVQVNYVGKLQNGTVFFLLLTMHTAKVFWVIMVGVLWIIFVSMGK